MGRSLLGPLEAAYLEAFLLGDGRGIPREVWDAFRKAGVVHVLVVSGLHVGLMASIGLIGLSLIRIPRVLRYHLLSAGLVTYCLLTGGNPPILRATIMGVLLCFGRAAGREAPVLNSLGLAAILILAMTPRALADPSFQLSFSAILGLFTLTPWFAKRFGVGEPEESDPLDRIRPDPETESVLRRWGRISWEWIAKGLAASCGAWIAISPVVAWHFHTFTPSALIANLVVIPWSSLLITVGFLVYAIGWLNPFMAMPFAATFSWLVYGLNHVVIWMANFPGASWKW
jgi:competence protein ComEC